MVSSICFSLRFRWHSCFPFYYDRNSSLFIYIMKKERQNFEKTKTKQFFFLKERPVLFYTSPVRITSAEFCRK
jgi:hypothetical protein